MKDGTGTVKRHKDGKAFTVICAVIAEMDLAVLNLINVFFISKGLGDEGVSAYEIVVPCLFLVCGFIALGYNGIQAVCSKDYGSGDKELFNRHKNAGYGNVRLFPGNFILYRNAFHGIGTLNCLHRAV